MGFVVPAWVRVNLAANRAGYVAGVAIAGSVEARERRMNYQKLAEKKDKKAQAHEVRARSNIIRESQCVQPSKRCVAWIGDKTAVSG